MPFRPVLTALAAASLVSLAGLLAPASPALASGPPVPPRPRVEALLARMTLEEKVGQLNLVSGHHAVTGPYTRSDVRAAVLSGQAGGLFNVYGAAYTRSLQEMAVRETRLGIPLLLGFDVLHGYRTIFPIPLGQAASWDLEGIEESERIAAREASAAGVNWLFAPMVDVSRDPRWGRVAEGSGESTWLGAKIAAARVRGLIGRGMQAADAVAPCVKHFAGNGATEGGRDYSGMDLSERAMRETQLPPFQAAIAAGAPCVMSAFNAVDGVPGVANARMLRDILRGEWGFGGVVVSDFGAVEELTVHGVAETPREAVRQAFTGGTEIDMESRTYADHLAGLVREGSVPEELLDDAVRRVLALKEDLGLFDDPFRRSDPAREAAVIGQPAHRQAALRLAEKSLVLLKNDNETLPLSPKLRRLAVIGPLGASGADTMGPWSAHGDPHTAVTLADGVRAVVRILERILVPALQRPHELIGGNAQLDPPTRVGEADERQRPVDQRALFFAVQALFFAVQVIFLLRRARHLVAFEGFFLHFFPAVDPKVVPVELAVAQEEQRSLFCFVFFLMIIFKIKNIS